MRSDPSVSRTVRHVVSGVSVVDQQITDLGPSGDLESLRTESNRTVRGGTLRDILDAEYRRCYRFESFSGFVDDLKGLIRRVVARDDVEGESLRSSFPPKN